MSEPFVGQIIPVGFNYAPVGWAFCDGSLLQISRYSVLFNLIGTTFGGDGQTTFGLPDLRGRVVVGSGQGAGLSNYSIGQPGGAETVPLTAQQAGAHTHGLLAANAADTADPASRVAIGTNSTTGITIYGASGTQTSLVSTSMSQAGGGAPHANIQPYQTISYIIALEGIFPSQN